MKRAKSSQSTVLAKEQETAVLGVVSHMFEEFPH